MLPELQPFDVPRGVASSFSLRRLCLRSIACFSSLLMVVALLCLPGRAAAQAMQSASEMTPSRADIFLGYSYWHPLGGTIYQRPFTPIKPGAVLSGSYYFGRYLGAQVEGAGFPNGDNDSIYTVEGGPIVRYPLGRFSPFIHALGGGSKVAGPASQPSTLGWALTGGVGLDYILPLFGNRLAVRPQADYQFSHTDFGPIGTNGLTGGLAEISAYRLTGGLAYRFGASSTPSRPLAYGCTAEPSTIYPGDPVTTTGSSISSRQTNRKRIMYTWATSGGHILSGDGNGAPANENATITTTGLAPGDYVVTGHIVEGKHASQRATCTTNFTVQPPPPPTIACSASPIAIAPGGQTVINAYANSPQNRPLRYSYSTTAGQILPYANNAAAQQSQVQQGQMQQRLATPSDRVVLDTSGISPGTINVGCTVTDDLNQTATATAVVQVNPPPAPLASAHAMCTLSFERDRRRPARVNNEGKACLDDVALSLNRDPGAKLTITGEYAPRETRALAQQRAINARAYLIDEKGIDPARITLRVGTSNDRTAHLTLFPYGAPPDLSITDEAPSSGRASGDQYVQPQVIDVPANSMPAQTFRPSPGVLTTPQSLVLPPIHSGTGSTAATRHRSSAAARRRAAARAAAASGAASTAASGGADASQAVPSGTAAGVTTTHHGHRRRSSGAAGTGAATQSGAATPSAPPSATPSANQTTLPANSPTSTPASQPN